MTPSSPRSDGVSSRPRTVQIGAQGVQQAIAALDGKSVQKEIKTELIAVTKENMADPSVSAHLYKANC